MVPQGLVGIKELGPFWKSRWNQRGVENNRKRDDQLGEIKVGCTVMKRCSTSLITREMQSKTAMKYHLTSIKMVNKNNTNKEKST